MKKIALIYGYIKDRNVRVIATQRNIDEFVQLPPTATVEWRDRHTNDIIRLHKRAVVVTHIEMEFADGRPLEPKHFYME